MKIPRLPPLLLVLVLAITMLVLDRALPLFRVLQPPVAYLGAAPATLGVLIVLISAGYSGCAKPRSIPLANRRSWCRTGSIG